MDKNRKVLILNFLIQRGPEPSSMADINDVVLGCRTSIQGHVRDLRKKGFIRMEKNGGADGGWRYAYFATPAASSYMPPERKASPPPSERRKALIIQFLLQRSSEPTSMKHISDVVECSYSTIGRHVKDLIEEGFVGVEKEALGRRGWKWSYFVTPAAASSKYAKQEILGSKPVKKDPFWASIERAVESARKNRLRMEKDRQFILEHILLD